MARCSSTLFAGRSARARACLPSPAWSVSQPAPFGPGPLAAAIRRGSKSSSVLGRNRAPSCSPSTRFRRRCASPYRWWRRSRPTSREAGPERALGADRTWPLSPRRSLWGAPSGVRPGRSGSTRRRLSRLTWGPGSGTATAARPRRRSRSCRRLTLGAETPTTPRPSPPAPPQQHPLPLPLPGGAPGFRSEGVRSHSRRRRTAPRPYPARLPGPLPAGRRSTSEAGGGGSQAPPSSTRSQGCTPTRSPSCPSIRRTSPRTSSMASRGWRWP